MSDDSLMKLPALLPAKGIETIGGEISLPMDERPYRLLGLGVLFLTFVVFGLWAALAPLNSAVIVAGQVTVASQNKQVQHLDGGLVKAIHVHDGGVVTAGQVLLELEDTQWRSQLENVQGQLWDVDAALMRLAAERDGLDKLSWPDELQKSSVSPVLAEILKTQAQLFTVRRQALAAGQDILVQRLAQTQRQIEGTEKQITSLRNRRNSLGDDVKSLEKLAGQNLVAKSTLRQNQRDYEELEGDTTKAVSEVARLGEVLAETRQQMLLGKEEYLKEVGTEISNFQTKRIQLLAQKQGLEDKLSRVAITAPATGKIKGLNMVTVGGVITAGHVIMDVVPSEQEFKIIAQLSPADIDSITPGQVAEVKFSLFNNARNFPVICADLIDVSADTLINQSSQMPYYKATLSIQQDGVIFLKNKGITLVPGMPVEVLLQTGQQSLLNYLFKPLTDIISHAFNES